LRHSFATHLLETGTDLKMHTRVINLPVCRQAGKSSKTTEIYTHVSNRDLKKIKSPLDNIKVDKENS